MIVSELRPLVDRERPLIRNGTFELGGVLATRVGIVVDIDENPEVYQEVIDQVDERLADSGATDFVSESEHTTFALSDGFRIINRAVTRLTPFLNEVYKEVIKEEATS